MNYQVGDLIIRLQNAAFARRRNVVLPFSNLNKAVLTLLSKEKFLEEVKETDVEGKKMLSAKLKYVKRNPVLQGVQIISKPSLRTYIKKTDIHALFRKSLNTLVISTNKGVMTGRQAEKEGVGGELLFEVW